MTESLATADIIMNCANYNEVTVSENMETVAGAICGEVDLSVNEGYNHMLICEIQDCLNTAAVNKIYEDGKTLEGGGVCGDIELNYGTCTISRCLNIGNTVSEYNSLPNVRNSSPSYTCTDYYTERDMSIRDMKNISKNLPSFSYPGVWGINSLYGGFPHPYGSGEQEEVWAYSEQKKQEMTDNMLENVDESELILMQRYADMLASMGMGGYWPEDKEHNNYCKYLLEWDDSAENYYAVIDINEDGQKELLVDICGIVYIYRYNLKNGEIAREETQQGREEFEQGYENIGQIEWLSLSSSNYQIYSQAYTQYYLGLLKKDIGSDVGAEFMEKEMDDVEFIKKISNDYGLEFKEIENGYEYAGYSGQEAVFSIYLEDGGGLNYQGEQINGATVFGLYPGMKEMEAKETLFKYGFVQEGENNYHTGGAPGNYFVYFTVENGIVKSISIYQGSLYTG